MRATFNSSFMQSASDLSRSTAELARRQREVSSGRRVNTASDDPSAATGAVREHSEMAALDRYAQTADNANSRLSIADSVLSDMLEQLTSAKTTILGAQGSAATPSQRAALADQLAGIRDAIYGDFATTFNGTYLFSGQSALVAPYSKAADGTVSAYAGSADDMTVDIDRHMSVDVTFNADTIARGTDATDIFAVLSQAITAMQSGDAAGMAAAGVAVERAFSRATAAQSRNGTALRTIEVQQGRVADLHRASEGRADNLELANMAESITKMSQADTAYRAALAAIGNTGKTTLMDYL